MADQEKITQATKDAERQEAKTDHEPDRMPTSEEEQAAERAGGPSEETRKDYKEMAERGANQKGEGRID